MYIHPYIDKQGFINQLRLSEEQVQSGGYKPGGIWFNDTLSVVCGTYPPNREYVDRKGYIHYSSPRNKFWRHVDNLYGTELYIPTKVASNEKARIENALDKIQFMKSKRLGFIDIFSKVNRRVENSSKDSDLIPVETIFDNSTITEVIEGGIIQFVFVYSLSRDTFIQSLAKKFNVFPEIVRNYNTDGVPLEVKKVQIDGKEIYLSYSPIHGKIYDDLKRAALKKAIEFDI